MNRTKILCIVLCLYAFNIGAQTFLWSNQQQFPANSISTSILNDPDDNAIVSGEFNNYSKNGIAGSFLMRYSQTNGSQLWKIQFNYVQNLKVAIDVYNRQILTTHSDHNIQTGGYYVNRYDLSGSLLKSVNLLPMINGSHFNKIHSIAADESGGYYLVGTYQKNFQVQKFALTAPPPGEERVFVAKFNTKDSCLWIETSTSGTSFPPLNCCVDKNQNLILTGKAVGNFLFQGYKSPSQTNTYEVFILKINKTGVVDWLKNIGSTTKGFRQISGICTDNDGGIYACGLYDHELGINCNLSGSKGFNDIFLLKANSDGECAWVQQIGGINNEGVGGIAIDPINGGVFIAGNFEEICTIGNYQLSSASSSTSTGVPDAFVAKYDPGGDVKWAMKLGADSCGLVRNGALVANKEGIVFLCGQFKCKASFGYQEQTTSGSNSFIAALDVANETSISSLTIGRDIQFYPNPSSGIIWIRKVKLNQKVNISVYNVLGIHILDIPEWPAKNNAQVTIDLSGQPKGIYFVHCNDGNSTVVYKQIIN